MKYVDKTYNCSEQKSDTNYASSFLLKYFKFIYYFIKLMNIIFLNMLKYIHCA